MVILFMIADRLTQFLETSNPIYPAFLSFLDGAIISYSPSTYADCLRTIKKNPAVIREINHPIYDSTDFFLGSNDALFGLFKQWAEEYTINNPAKKRGFLSIGDAAKKLNAGPDNVLSWARRNPQSTQYCFGQLLVRSNVVDSLADMWERAVVLDRLVEQQINEFPVKIKSRAKTLIIDAFKAEKNPNVVEGCYFPQANNAEALYREIVEPCLLEQFEKQTANRGAMIRFAQRSAETVIEPEETAATKILDLFKV